MAGFESRSPNRWRFRKMKRVLLFIATNIAVVIVLSIVLRLLGVDRILDERGVGLNYANLLVFAAVFGFGGSFISAGDFQVDGQTGNRSAGHCSAEKRDRNLACGYCEKAGRHGRHRHAGSGCF